MCIGPETITPLIVSTTDLCKDELGSLALSESKEVLRNQWEHFKKIGAHKSSHWPNLGEISVKMNNDSNEYNIEQENNP